MTHAVYQYEPLSLKALANLIEHEVYGEPARFMRQMALGMWAVATNRRLDDVFYKPYIEKLFEEFYCNPFKHKTAETGEEIVNHLIGRG